MGIRNGIFVFLGPPYRGGKDRSGRPGSRVKEIGFERERGGLPLLGLPLLRRERERGRERERERARKSEKERERERERERQRERERESERDMYMYVYIHTLAQR